MKQTSKLVTLPVEREASGCFGKGLLGGPDGQVPEVQGLSGALPEHVARDHRCNRELMAHRRSVNSLWDVFTAKMLTRACGASGNE